MKVRRRTLGLSPLAPFGGFSANDRCRQNRTSAIDAVDGSSTGIAMCHVAVF